MMLFLLSAIVALASGAAAAEVNHSELANLRGAPGGGDAERDLAVSGSSGSSKKSLSVEYWKCVSSGDLCFDQLAFCETYASTWAYTSARGTAAYAYEELCVYAQCEALAISWAQSYAVISGKVKVDIARKTSGNTCTNIDVDMSLLTSTLTVSIAGSVAAAAASVEAWALSYTSVQAACANPTAANSVLCAGAAAGTKVAGSATAVGFSGGLTGSISGATAGTFIDVEAVGVSVTSVKACLATFATSFSLSASASASFVAAFAEVCSANFAVACAKAHEKRCGGNPSGYSFCSYSPAEACSKAVAFGDAHGLAVAFAAAYGAAQASTGVTVILHATADKDFKMNLAGGLFGEAVVETVCH